MNLKKALALLLALTLCLGMFAACAAKTEAPAEDGSTSQPAADAAPAEESQSNVTPVGEYPIVKEPITFKVMGRKDPAVALVNNGAEDTKGTPMYREAHGLLKANPAIRFVGNIEPRDIMAGEVDVIVCDGFVGNVVLKLTEGVAGTLLGMLKDIFMQSIVTKLCYLGVKGGLRNLKHMMDSEEIGGAPLLGAAKPVIKAHGSSKAKGIKNAIRQAKLCVANDLCGTMQSALAEVAAKAAAEKTDAE